MFDHQRLRLGFTEPLGFVISRQEVEEHALARVLSRLKPLVADSSEAWRYKGQVTLVVSGYEDDPRSLVDVPEVRLMLRDLEAGWKEWPFFLNQVDDSIKLLIASSAGERFDGGGWVELSRDRLSQMLLRGLVGIKCVFERYGFPESELQALSAGLIEVFEQAGLDPSDRPA